MIYFRDATQADFQLIYEIKKSSLKPYIEKIWGWNDEVQLNIHIRDFKPEQVKIIQNEFHDEIGLLNFTEDSGCIYIKNILICDFAQGKGIGTSVLTDLIERAASTNRKVELQVFKVNERAKKLYEGLGFITIGQTDLHYQMVLDSTK